MAIKKVKRPPIDNPLIIVDGVSQTGLSQNTHIDLVLDTSASMEKLWPAIYVFCMDLVAECGKGKGKVHYGITTFAGDDSRCVTFDKKEFTEDSLVFLRAMLDLQVTGGSRNGREDLENALITSLNKLERATDKAQERCLILITDQVPTDIIWLAESVRPEDTVALRSAVIFAPAEGVGQLVFLLTDRKGRADRGKSAVHFDISLLLKERYLTHKLILKQQLFRELD